MKLEHKLILSGAVLLIVCFLIPNEYMKYKKTECIVLDKIMTQGKYTHMYLILKDNKGRIFDLDVSPATYSQHIKGDNITFELREHDIHQTKRDNIYFFGICILYCISIYTIIYWTIIIVYIQIK